MRVIDGAVELAAEKALSGGEADRESWDYFKIVLLPLTAGAATFYTENPQKFSEISILISQVGCSPLPLASATARWELYLSHEMAVAMRWT